MLRFAEADALYRFKKGFRSLADIRHPNLVRLHELIKDRGGQWLLSLEPVDGVDFVSYLRAGERNAFVRVRDATAQLARGLRTLHAHGKLHRDIKPSNVLVTAQGRVVLLDFGLLGELGPGGELESATVVMAGTPIYMAPEQADGPVVLASDWYSVGVMLYEALVGRVPFEGSLVEIVARKKRGLEAPLRAVTPAVPADLAAICEGLLEPRAEARMDGDEVLARLAAASATPSRLHAGTALPLAPRRTTFFVGRGEALATLRQAFEASRQHAVAVLVQGGAGMGKTALVGHFLDGLAVTVPDAVTLAGRCYRRESVPYKGVDSLIDALSRHLNGLPVAEAEALVPPDADALARLFPVLGRVAAVAAAGGAPLPQGSPPQLERRRAVRALRSLLGRLAERQPLVLFVDDVHWGDRDSAILLEKLVRPPGAPRLLMIGTFRSELRDASPLLRAFDRQRASLVARGVDLREIEAGDLEPAEARALAAALFGDDANDAERARVDAVVREAGGNPLFLHELVRFAADADRLPGARLSGEIRLGDVIMARVARLPAPARTVLEVLAVADGPVEVETLRHAAGLGAGTEEALAALGGTRLVRRRAGGDEIEMFHDRIRDAVLEHLDEADLRRRHRALAVALESSGRAEPETLAVHFQMIEDRERAAGYAAAAAARAERALAFDRAARLYRLALDLLPSASAEGDGLVVKLAAALANAGRSREAADIYLRAVRNRGYLDPLELQRNAAEKLLISGHIDRGLAVLRHVLRHVGIELAERQRRTRLELWWRRARLRLRRDRTPLRPAEDCDPAALRRIDICWSAAIGLCLVDVLHASLFHARNLELAQRVGEPGRLARALAMEIFFGALEGADRDGGPALRRATALANREEGTYAVGLIELARGMLGCVRGEWVEAGRRLDAAASYLQEAAAGVAWELDTVEHFRLLSRLYRGAWEPLFAELPEMLERARERGDRYLEVHLGLWGACWQDLARDRPEIAAARAEETIGRWSHRGFHFQHFGHLMATAQARLYSGADDEIWPWMSERWPQLQRSRVLRIPLVHVQAHELRARCALASASSAESGAALLAAAAADARRVARTGRPWAQALAAQLEAGIARAGGRPEAAAAALERAETLFTSCAMALHAAVARRCRGTLLGGSEGAALRAEADQWLVARGIGEPARWARVLAPGW